MGDTTMRGGLEDWQPRPLTEEEKNELIYWLLAWDVPLWYRTLTRLWRWWKLEMTLWSFPPIGR